MFRKKAKVGVLAVVSILSALINPAFAADDPPKLISLGLNAATAIASEKDVIKGLKAAAKDEYTEWMWELIGGTEKFIFQNSEADLPGIKDKINNIVGIVGQIEKFAIAMTEGKYDDAAFAAIDQVVGTINHPLVSVTWAMAKLTYESHKAVQASDAALKVETLYGLMNNDRRLMGTIDPSSDSPPMIPETAASADYFFNKYVMTDDSARAALQAYVTTVLGETWPEQSWGDWIGSFSALGSGVDTTKNDELEMLDDQWRNKGRSWIINVIKQVNLMAKQSWAEARLRQELAKFKIFADRVSHFYEGDFAQMLKEFQAVKNIQSDLPNYPQYLAESQKQRQAMVAQIAKFKPSDINLVSGLIQTEFDWYVKCLSYATRADMVKQSGLAGSFMQERVQWKAISEQLNQFINAQKGKVVDMAQSGLKSERVMDDSVRANLQDAYTKQYFNEIVKAYSLKEFEWSFAVDKLTTQSGALYSIPVDAQMVTELILDLCNKGDIADAEEILKAWETAAQKHLNQWKGAMSPLPHQVPGLSSYGQKIGALTAIVGDPSSIRDSKQPDIHMNSQERLQFYATVTEWYAVRDAWLVAVSNSMQAALRMDLMADQEYAENIAKPTEVVNAFKSLADARARIRKIS
ncbi:MAG: hypothetical protein KJ915_11885 [Candidatus Omnitrophica bacterium]|nr:hypothetical protein [Candidatus Omnitrophota bacterium]